MKHKQPETIEVTNEVKITEEHKTIVSRLSNGEKGEVIGLQLGYRQGTFAFKLRELRIKYGCINTTHLVAYFLREGIIK